MLLIYRKALLGLAFFVLVMNSGGIAEEDEIQRHMTLKTSMDFGHIVNGSIPEQYAGELSPNVEMLPLSRANVLMIQNVSLGQFDVAAGLAGLIWWPYGGGVTDASERVKKVKPMVPVARARWQFGNKETTHGFFQAGTFAYKYNPDAKNLGEYLYRAGTYPGFLWTTEGWLLTNRAGNYSHGALFGLSHMGGVLKHNFSLFMETAYYPVGDFSPGYDFSVTMPWLEFGGGVVLNHYLALHPSDLKPESDENYYIHAKVFDASINDTAHYYGPKNELPGIFFEQTATSDTLHQWSHKGIKLMGRAALSLNSLLPEDLKGPEDLRLFAELAVLGLENRPLYYEKLAERIPIMFGINLPTFKLLDILTVQGEYYKSPFNDINYFNTQSLPIWVSKFDRIDPTNDFSEVQLDPQGKVVPLENHDDDFKWTIYAKKKVNKIMTVYAQAGSDHFRLMDGKYKASSVPVTSKPSEWYYLFRVDFLLH